MHRGKVCYDKSSLRANAKQSSKTVITRSDKRRSNRIHIENNELGATHVDLYDNISSYFINWCRVFRYTPLAMTCTGKKVLSLGGELERGCNNIDNTKREPSPEFLSSSQLTKKFNPLTKREGSDFSDTVYSLFTTHHSLIFYDTVFSRFTSHFSLKASAFTLAEVLVTLGIIGVVSAMTVPTLMQNYQRQSYVTQLHKTYNEMSQALLRYQTDKNAINLTEAGMTSQDAVNDFIKTYFKTVQECDTVNSCFASSYKTLSGETLPTYYFTMQNVKAYVLANGVSVRLGYNTDECAASNGVRIVAVAIDINGKKGPNIGGRDLFWMYFYNNGLIDDKPDDLVSNAPLTTEQREASFNKRCDTKSGSPDGCMGKIINDGWQMNY